MWQKLKNYYHLAQALFSALYFGFPSKKLTVIGVTGTDGKTTTVNMIYHILKRAGKKASMISSVNAQIGHKTYDTGFHVSTPSPWQVQKYLKKAAEAGSQYFVLESTSHGLDQNRLAFVKFKVGVLTNIAREHLDYHKTFENYREAKLKLFKNAQFSVINAQDVSYGYVKNHVGGKVITYSKNDKDNYNLQNASAAIAATGVLGISQKLAKRALETFPGVVGRMEDVRLAQPFRVIVDFAHTPNGLTQALKFLRSQKTTKSSRLIAVFGAAGERDKSKRPLMGQAADEFADIIVLTAEDPRSESAQTICEQIESGIKKKQKNKNYFIITDRSRAIEYAVGLAKSGDIVTTFGKSHEKSMCFGKTEYPWDEFAAAKTAIKKRVKNGE